MFTTDTEPRIDFTGRNIELTDALKQHAEEKIAKLRKYVDEISEVHVTLSVEKYRHTADVAVKARSLSLSGQETTDDMYASLSAVFDKIDRQAKKSKEKRWGNKRRQRKTVLQMGVFTRDSVVSDNAGRPRLLKRSNLEVSPMSIQDAVLRMVAAWMELMPQWKLNCLRR